MRLFTSTLTILIFLSMTQNAAAQRKFVKARRTTPTIITCGICNQDAIYLPKPIYPEAAAAVNISGAVGVDILIDTKGNVIEAKAVSGHPLLRSEAVKAALRAKFTPKLLSGKPVMVRGSILYKFISGKFEDPKENAKSKIGIVNGRATSLPIPEYSQESKDLCANGRVEIEVVIGEDGTVMQATAVSGDDLLFESGLEAAKKAKFRTYDDIPPIKTRGILVYNYPSETKCVDVGVVNKKAISLSKPIINGNVIIERPTEIPVRIVIDLSGTVVAARALKGHPLIRKDLENAARKARFSPALINSKPFKIKATIVYKVMPDRTVEF